MYAAAVTLAWMVTGELPGDLYVDTVITALRDRLGPSAALVDLLTRAGAHAPSDRPSAAELREALRSCAGDAPVRLGPVTRGTPLPSRGGRWVRVDHTAGPAAPARIAMVGVAVLVSLAIVGVVTLWGMAELTVQAAPPDPPAVARMRAYDALPVCADVPTRMEGQSVPRWESSEPGGREASGGRIVDIDADGNRDLLFGHTIDAEFRVFWGTGASFDERPQRVPAMRMTYGFSGVVDAADVDGDGRRDLVAVSPESMAFVLVRALGGRTFGPPLRVETGGVPKTLRAADWDGDGRADLVYTVTGYARDQVLWRRSLGESRFDAEHQMTGDIDAMDVQTDAADRALALVVAEDGRVKRYPVRADARRSADPDIDVAVPIERVSVVRAVTGTNQAYVWNASAPDASVRVSLTDGSVCRYDFEAIVSDVGFFDDDDLIDGTNTLTCGYCTSSYQLLLGTK